jgi:hypothetical protein
MKFKNLLLAGALALLLAPAGCIFSPDDGGGDGPPPPPPPELPFPGTANQLMKNFQTVYETLDYDDYREMLHPDFLTYLKPETTSEFPTVGTTLDFEEEERIHRRMFSGDAVTDPEGNLVPGILAISFSLFQQEDTWAVSPPNDIIPNAEWSLYSVEFLFDRGQEFSTLRVDGQIKFYVTSRDSFHEGADRKYYQLIGQVDLTTQ